MHVKDLEMKSKYYEAECRRLGSLLQWYMAENQALRFSLHSGSSSSNASMTKQESAVLLLGMHIYHTLLSLFFMLGLVKPVLENSLVGYWIRVLKRHFSKVNATVTNQ